MALSCRSQKPSKVPSKDGRSPEAVLLRRTKAALVKHIGGKPTTTQRALIDRAGMLTVHIARMDEAAMKNGGFGDLASRQYLAWSAHLTRTMKLLGFDEAAAKPPSVGDAIAAAKARRTAAA